MKRFIPKVGDQELTALLLLLRKVPALDVNLLETQVAETDSIQLIKTEFLLVTLSPKAEDHRLLGLGEIHSQVLVKRIATLVVLVSRFDSSFFSGFKRLFGPLDISATA